MQTNPLHTLYSPSGFICCSHCLFCFSMIFPLVLSSGDEGFTMPFRLSRSIDAASALQLSTRLEPRKLTILPPAKQKLPVRSPDPPAASSSAFVFDTPVFTLPPLPLDTSSAKTLRLITLPDKATPFIFRPWFLYSFCHKYCCSFTRLPCLF